MQIKLIKINRQKWMKFKSILLSSKFERNSIVGEWKGFEIFTYQGFVLINS